MNKKAIVLISIMALVLINGLALGNKLQVSSVSNHIDASAYQSLDSVIYESIAPTTDASIVYRVSNLLGYGGIDFYVSAVSTGSVTTASVQWTNSRGDLIGSPVILTSGTKLTAIHSVAIITILSPDPLVTANITANIEVAD